MELKHKHKEIVVMKNNYGELVVTSRQIAEDFGKEHKNIIRDIEGKVEEIGSKLSASYFIPSSYKDSMNRVKTEYLLTRDGFSLLVMGFTGSKALQWKLKYIEAFNKMEEHIKNKSFNASKLSKELQAILMLDEKTVEMDNRLTSLEERMTIETGSQKVLQDLVNKKVITVLGGKDSPAYGELGKKAFRQCWKNFKDILQVASYKDTPVKDFDFAKQVIESWEPTRELELMIKGCNTQVRLQY